MTTPTTGERPTIGRIKLTLASPKDSFGEASDTMGPLAGRERQRGNTQKITEVLN